MVKIYTKTGDAGSTSLANGERVKKSSDLIELYGSLDELNVFLSHALDSLADNQDFSSLVQQIYRIQKEIFVLSSYLLSGKKITVFFSKY